MKEDSLLMLLAPEMLEAAEERYTILREIHTWQPVGRHLLVVQTKLSESTIRSHVEYMERTGLLVLKPGGMILTSKGESFLTSLSRYFRKSTSLTELEEKLSRLLSMKRVIVLRGDADASEEVKRGISREAALLLTGLIHDGDVVAIGGGEVMAGVMDSMPDFHMPIDVLPACGTVSRKVEYLPNVVAARLAERLGGTYHIMQIPEGLSPDLYRQVKNALPQSKVMDSLYAKVRILVTGLNDFEDMMKWYEFPDDVKNRLIKEKAQGECLGLFANQSGTILYRLYHAGLTKEDIPSIPHVVIAAGGRHKGKAILAMARAGIRGTLVTDEGAAEEILAVYGTHSNRRVQKS